jgi:hypothetical protein
MFAAEPGLNATITRVLSLAADALPITPTATVAINIFTATAIEDMPVLLCIMVFLREDSFIFLPRGSVGLRAIWSL